MIDLSRHLAWGELNRLADDELDADSRARAMAHVASCSKCSQSLSFIRQLGEAGRDMKHPRPPKGLLDEILRHRSEGARVILPAVSPPSPRGRRLPAAAAAAVIVAALAGLATLTLTSEAGAGASELTVIPAQPVPGEEIRLEYRPGGLLAGETALRLRLRLRRPETEPPRETLGAYDEVILQPASRWPVRRQLPVAAGFRLCRHGRREPVRRPTGRPRGSPVGRARARGRWSPTPGRSPAELPRAAEQELAGSHGTRCMK